MPGLPSVSLASTALVALAAFCWGLSGGIGGLLIADGWNPLVVSFYRGAIGLLIVLAWLGLRPGGHGLAQPRLWGWAALAGLGVAGNFGFYFLSIDEGSLPVAATLMYCAPVFVFLVSLGLGIERASARKWVSLALVMLGILLLTRIYDVEGAAVTLPGIAFGLLAGLSYGVFIFGFKYASRHGSSQAILSIAFATLALVLGWAEGVFRVPFELQAPGWTLFVTLGILGAGLSFVIYIRGLSRSSPTLAAVVAMLEPATAAVFGVLVLGDELGALQWLGMALILLTVTGLSCGDEEASPEEAQVKEASQEEGFQEAAPRYAYS